MRSALNQIVRQFLRFHFGRWTPRDESNPIESWQRAKFEAWQTEEREARRPLGDRRAGKQDDADAK